MDNIQEIQEATGLEFFDACAYQQWEEEQQRYEDADMIYTIHARSNHGVYREVGTATKYKDALNQLQAAAIKNRLGRYWISLESEIHSEPRLYEFDPDHDTLEDLEIVING